MPKYLLTLLCSLLWVVGQAQISILPEDLPNANTELPIALKDSVLIDVLGASNSSQVWDWSDGLAIDTLTGLNTDYVAFGPVAGTTGEVEFVDSDFSRTSNLRTILGFDIASFLPNTSGAQPLPADAYFSTDSDGNVYLDGITSNIQIDGIDLGKRFLYSDPAYKFYSVGELGDSYTASTLLINDIYAEEFPEEIPLIKYVRISLDVVTSTEIDAHGELILPDTTFSVLRYRENSTIHAKLTPWAEVLGAPLEITPDLISDELIENLGFDPNEIFFDTTFVSTLYRYYTNGINYPVASVNFIGDNTVVENIEYYIKPIDLNVDFFVSYLDEDCNFIYLWNESDGLGVNYDLNFGDGDSLQFYGNLVNPLHPDDDPVLLYHTYPDGAGVYDITLSGTDALGNSDEANFLLELDCWATDIETLAANNGYDLYPNPISEVFSIKLEEKLTENGEIQVFDMMGKQIISQNISLGENNWSISMKDVPQGTYLVQMTLNNGALILKDKLVK